MKCIKRQKKKSLSLLKTRKWTKQDEWRINGLTRKFGQKRKKQIAPMLEEETPRVLTTGCGWEINKHTELARYGGANNPPSRLTTLGE